MDHDGPGQSSGPANGGGRGRAVVVAEVLGLLLMLAGIAGTGALLIAAHRRVASEPAPEALVLAAPAVESGIEPGPVEPEPIPLLPEPETEPEPEPEPEPPPEPEVDPTAEALARLDAERAALAEDVGRKNRALAILGGELEKTGTAIERSLREADEASRRRAVLVAEAEKLEAETQFVGLERDVLERRRDEAERNRREAIERPGYAILPYRGPNGTWRRPIPVECRDGSATLEPGGMSFSMVELLAMPGRPGPFGAAVKRLAALLEAQGAPGGERVEPYVLFVVRPDGIRPFYEARSALDANGVPYGYELVDQDWEIEYPAWDDPTIWESLDAAMQADPTLADQGGDGAIAGPGGLLGSGGGPLVGDGTFPPRPPEPGEMVDALRGLDDLYPGDGSDPYGPAGSDLGGRGPGLGSMAGDPGAGGGYGGEPDLDGFGGRSGVIPILPEGSPDPGLADGSLPGDVGGGAGGHPSGFGGPGMVPGSPGGPPATASGAGDVPGRPDLGGEVGATGLGGSGEIPGRADGGPDPGLVAGNGWGASGDRAGTGSGLGGTGTGTGPGGMPPGAGPIPPGMASGPASGGTGVGWQDGGPGASPSGGLGQVLGGLLQSVGAGIPGGAGSGGGDGSAATGGGPAAGSPRGEAGRSGLAGGPGGMAASGAQGGGPGGSGGAGIGSGMGLGAGIGPFELVVACGRNGVTVYPGGYRIGTETLTKDTDRLVRTLQAVVASARRREPATARMPGVRFLVEPAGRDAYWVARGQVELAGLGWPISWQASQPRTFTIFGSERW